MGEGSRWDLGQVARCVWVRVALAAHTGDASADPRTPARNVISVLCLTLASKLNVSQCLLEFPVFLTLTVFNRITLFSLNVTQLYYQLETSGKP